MPNVSLTAEQQSSYRWVMAVVVGILMASSFVALSSFNAAAPQIAASIHQSANTVAVFGGDSYSIALFLAFFLGHGGLFDTRIKTGVFVTQVLLIVPQLLIPIAPTLWLITILRFCQGLEIMMVALFSLQLGGWFRESEKALSLAFALGAITGGGALGGILVSAMSSLSWQAMYYWTAVIMIVAAIIYFVFARNAPTLQKQLVEAKKSGQKHESAWKNPMTWLMGFIQIPLTWTLFSVGGFLPGMATKFGYNGTQVGHLMMIWGFAGFGAAFIGAFIGDSWAKNKKDRHGVFVARVGTITIANVIFGIGAVLAMTLGKQSFGMMVVAAIFIAFMMMIPPNFWASPSALFPTALVGAGAFGMGVISNSTSAIGPVVTSFLTPDVAFTLIAILAAAGVILNLFGFRISARLNKPQASVGHSSTQETL